MLLAVAQARGGAEALIPVLKALRPEWGPRIKVIARTEAADCFRAEGFTVEERIPDTAPDLLLTGTSWGSDLEPSFLRTARRQGTPSLTLLDSWIHYRERFLNHGEGVLSKDLLPDRIGVMDDFALEEMVEEGFPWDCLRVVGHPGFDELARWTSRPESKQERANLRRGWGLDLDERLLVFFSQPSPGVEQAWSWLLRSLTGLPTEGRCKLLLKLHPREDEREWRQRILGTPVPVKIAHGEGANLLLKIADGVVGLTSQTLVKGYLLGRAVISIRPPEEERDGLMLSRAGYLNRCGNAEQLRHELEKVLVGNGTLSDRKKLPDSLTDGQGTQRVLQQLQELLGSEIIREKLHAG